MSAGPGVTNAFDLAAETLQFIVDNWETQSAAVGEPDWIQPVLHHGNEKLSYPEGERTREVDLRNHDIVTATYVGATSTPQGTEFNLDREAEVDVKVEAQTEAPGGVVDTGEDFAKLVWAIRRAILAERSYPVTNPDCLVEYHWLTINNESFDPAGLDQRQRYEEEFTVTYHGLEQPPDIN